MAGVPVGEQRALEVRAQQLRHERVLASRQEAEPHLVVLAAERPELADLHLVLRDAALGVLAATRQVCAGDDREHARQRRGARRVDADDARVRVRAAQHAPLHHARQREVGAVVGAPGHLVDAIRSHRPRADDAEVTSLGHSPCLLESMR
jgi:hypothetical protein